MKDEKFATNTDALIRAFEIADECDTILILYQKKEEAGSDQGFFHVGDTTVAELNWMLDRFKLWLLGPLRKDT